MMLIYPLPTLKFYFTFPFCTIVCTYRGQSYQNGEQFPNPDERCEDCVCRDGTIQCQRKQCDIPNCRDPVYPPGACCPVCTGMELGSLFLFVQVFEIFFF